MRNSTVKKYRDNTLEKKDNIFSKKKAVLFILAGLLACISLAGCSGKGTSSAGSVSETESGTAVGKQSAGENSESSDGNDKSESNESGSSAVTGDGSTEHASGVDTDIDYEEMLRKLAQIKAVVDEYYIGSGEEVSSEDILDGIYKGYLEALEEPYTVYYTKEEYSDLQESTTGKYQGIGVSVQQNVTTGLIKIVHVFAGTPAEEVGIKKGDIIYKVGGEDITGQDIYTVISKLKKEAGTEVNVEMYRESENEYISFDITCAEVEIPMEEHRMLDDEIGYIVLYEFEETTSEQFNDAVDELLKKGMKGLIIDLRDNPGGKIDSATDVLDRILPSGELLVYTVDKQDKTRNIYSDDDEVLDIPIVVIVNENSASASEIVTGCLQDLDAATILGTTTFGKGIVQYVIPFEDGSAMKLTSAWYYTPSGRCVHGTGIEPDIVVEEADESETGISDGDSSETEEKADVQLQAAREEIRSQLQKQ